MRAAGGAGAEAGTEGRTGLPEAVVLGEARAATPEWPGIGELEGVAGWGVGDGERDELLREEGESRAEAEGDVRFLRLLFPSAPAGSAASGLGLELNQFQERRMASGGPGWIALPSLGAGLDLPVQWADCRRGPRSDTGVGGTLGSSKFEEKEEIQPRRSEHECCNERTPQSASCAYLRYQSRNENPGVAASGQLCNLYNTGLLGAWWQQTRRVTVALDESAWKVRPGAHSAVLRKAGVGRPRGND